METSSTDFMDWLTYLDMEPNMFHRQDHYLAQIAAWICRSINPKNKVENKDFMIKFSLNEGPPPSSVKDKGAKSFFGRLLGAHATVTKKNKRR